jgi:hypothetical protein
MSAVKDGGPAFPVHGGDWPNDDPRNRILGGGMSLRDWFAGQALAGMLASGEDFRPSAGAEAAYLLADAMIAARREP